MSYDTDRYGLKKLSNQSLAVVECGIQICHPGHTTPRLHYRTYSAHFILEGMGVYILNGKTYKLGPGQGFMITPGADCIYTADTEHPWKYIYASFCGADDDALVHSAGLDEENVIFDFPLDEDMMHDIYAMHASGKRNECKGYDVTGYFLLCMSRLIRKNLSGSEKSGLSENYVRKACLYIEDHYSDRITVSDIARHVGIERTYLHRLFQKYMSCSPGRYLMNYKIEKAAEMLEDHDVALSEVALNTGFCDLSHLHKAFKARYGITPKKYRIQKCGEKDK